MGRRGAALAAGLGHRLLPDRRRRRAARRRTSPFRGHEVAAYTGQDRAGRPRARRGGAARQRGQGRRRHLGAGDGLRQAGSRVLPPRRIARRRRSTTTSRSVARVVRSTPRSWCCCPSESDGGCGSGSPPRASRCPTRLPRCSGRWRGGAPVSVPELEAATGVRRSRVELLVKVLAVDGAVDRDASTAGSPPASRGATTMRSTRSWSPHGVRRPTSCAAYAQGGGCLDVAPASRARRPHRGGRAVRTLLGVHRRAARGAAAPGPTPRRRRPRATWLRARDTELEPRKMWTAGIGDAAERPWKGRISLEVAPSRGRAVAFADDPAWPEIDQVTGARARRRGARLAARRDRGRARAAGARRGCARRAAVVRDAERPAPAAGRLAGRAGAARRSGIDVARPPRAARPAARARPLAGGPWRARWPRASRYDPVSRFPAGTLLLVDDTWRTGWTATIAAALLREAGAVAVAPLVAHQLP